MSCATGDPSPTVTVGQSAANAPTLPLMRATLDWVPREALPETRLRTLPEYCDGAYVEPVYALPLKSDPASFPTRLQASELSVLATGSR